MKFIDFKASHICPNSYGSILFNISTFFNVFSYFSLFFIAASFTMLLKHSLSKAQQVLSVFALIVAALGALYNKANSPKDSPDLYVFRYVGFSPGLNTF